MKKLIFALVLVLGCILLAGCSKKAVFVPQIEGTQKIVEQGEYNAILQVDSDGVETLFGFPKNYSGGSLEALVGVGNMSPFLVWASASNIKVYYGDSEPSENHIKVLGYDDLQTGVKVKNFFDKLAVGSVVALAAVGAAASGHHYETTTFSGSYTGPEWNQGGTFVGSMTTHYYDAEENKRNCEAVATTGASVIQKTKIRCENRYAVLAAEWFGSEFIEAGYSVMKKVVVKGLKVEKDPNLITAEVYANGNTSYFKFLLARADDEGEPILEKKESAKEEPHEESNEDPQRNAFWQKMQFWKDE